MKWCSCCVQFQDGFIGLQGKAWWRQRPQVLAMVAIALLGSAGLASTWSGPLRRGSAGKHKHLMSHGVPKSLMHANITAGYADTFCKSFVPSNLTTQHWVDEPMCQRANTTFKVPPIFMHGSLSCVHT